MKIKLNESSLKDIVLNANKIEESISKIKGELDNISIPNLDVLNEFNTEIAEVYKSIKNLKDCIADELIEHYKENN